LAVKTATEPLSDTFVHVRPPLSAVVTDAGFNTAVAVAGVDDCPVASVTVVVTVSAVVFGSVYVTVAVIVSFVLYDVLSRETDAVGFGIL
jgi:hypothetical protein